VNFNEIEKRARELATRAGKSLHAALVESGAGKDLFQNAKRGQIPSVLKIVQLAELLKTGVDYLLFGEVNNSSGNNEINYANEIEKYIECMALTENAKNTTFAYDRATDKEKATVLLLLSEYFNVEEQVETTETA